MILVSAFFPVVDGVEGEVFCFGPEVINDLLGGEAVVEHQIELMTEGFREVGDFTGTGAEGDG